MHLHSKVGANVYVGSKQEIILLVHAKGTGSPERVANFLLNKETSEGTEAGTMLEDAGNSIAILVNPMSGEEHNVRRYSTSIGREMGNDVVVTSDRTLSRQHALVQFINGKFYVQDLQSKNGTRLNGAAVSSLQLLKSGDELSVGLTRLIFLLIPSAELNTRIVGSVTESVDPVVPRSLIAR